MSQHSPLHIREHRSVLMKLEKRLLIWIARMLPQWVTSDHLTVLGFLGMLATGLCYWAASRDERLLLLVVPALAINWFGDSLDGTLARVRDCRRDRYGYYVDHLLDMAGASVLTLGIATSGLMTPWIALVLLAGFLLVCAESYLATHALGVFRLALMGIGGTELRIVLAFGTLLLMYKPVVQIGGFGPFLLFDVGGICAIAGLAAGLTYSAVRNARTLYKAEPLQSSRGAR